MKRLLLVTTMVLPTMTHLTTDYATAASKTNHSKIFGMDKTNVERQLSDTTNKNIDIAEKNARRDGLLAENKNYWAKSPEWKNSIEALKKLTLTAASQSTEEVYKKEIENFKKVILDNLKNKNKRTVAGYINGMAAYTFLHEIFLKENEYLSLFDTSLNHSEDADAVNEYKKFIDIQIQQIFEDIFKNMENCLGEDNYNRIAKLITGSKKNKLNNHVIDMFKNIVCHDMKCYFVQFGYATPIFDKDNQKITAVLVQVFKDHLNNKNNVSGNKINEPKKTESKKVVKIENKINEVKKVELKQEVKIDNKINEVKNVEPKQGVKIENKSKEKESVKNLNKIVNGPSTKMKFISIQEIEKQERKQQKKLNIKNKSNKEDNNYSQFNNKRITIVSENKNKDVNKLLNLEGKDTIDPKAVIAPDPAIFGSYADVEYKSLPKGVIEIKPIDKNGAVKFDCVGDVDFVVRRAVKAYNALVDNPLGIHVGIDNYNGNSSYAIAVIQALTAFPELQKEIIENFLYMYSKIQKDKNSGNDKERIDARLMVEYINLLHDILVKEPGKPSFNADAARFFDALYKYNPTAFGLNIYSNPTTFFVEFLAFLNGQLNLSKISKNNKIQYDLPKDFVCKQEFEQYLNTLNAAQKSCISDNFNVTLQNFFKQNCCKNKVKARYRSEFYKTINTQLIKQSNLNSGSIYDGLNCYAKLKNTKTNTYCATHKAMTAREEVSDQIAFVSNIFAVPISYGFNSEHYIPLQIPETLELGKYVANKEADDVLYVLSAVVFHTVQAGGNGSRYLTISRSSHNRSWINYNLNEVTELDTATLDCFRKRYLCGDGMRPCLALYKRVKREVFDEVKKEYNDFVQKGLQEIKMPMAKNPQNNQTVINNQLNQIPIFSQPNQIQVFNQQNNVKQNNMQQNNAQPINSQPKTRIEMIKNEFAQLNSFEKQHVRFRAKCNNGTYPVKKVRSHNFSNTVYTIPTTVGLENIGKICFRNSVDQCLANISCVAEWVLNNKKEMTDTIKNSKLKLAPKYYNFIKKLWTNNANYFAPDDYAKKIDSMNPLFKIGEAGDSKDYIIFLLEQLHAELKKPVPDNSERKKQLEAYFKNNPANSYDMQNTFNYFLYNIFLVDGGSFMSDLFYRTDHTNTVCCNCYKNFSMRNVPFSGVNGFQVANYIEFPLFEIKMFHGNIDNVVSIDQCFEYCRKTDLLTEQNSNYCNICKQLYDAYYGTRIHMSAPILVLHLNRGKNNMYNTKCIFTEDINLNNYVSTSNGWNDPDNIYTLTGVVTHMGSSGSDGHFVATTRLDDESEWVRHNDSITSVLDDGPQTFYKDILTFNKPYILIYQRKATFSRANNFIKKYDLFSPKNANILKDLIK